MWLIVLITVLSTEPLKFAYDPVAKVETITICEEMASVIAKHNPESRVLCIRQR